MGMHHLGPWSSRRDVQFHPASPDWKFAAVRSHSSSDGGICVVARASGLRHDGKSPAASLQVSAPLRRVSQVQGNAGRRVGFFLQERDNGTQQLFLCDKDSSDLDRTASSPWLNPHGAALRFVHKVFLPADFPASVTPNYIRFVGFMAVQVLTAHVSRVLAMQAMLLSVGVGAGKAVPIAAVTAWILKDGLGHLGAIALGTIVNTRFDSDPKRYRFWSAVIGKIADFVSILTLYWPAWFLLLSTLGSACGRISLSASQGSRAKVYESFTKSSNLGDVLRCAGSQTVAAQLLGTGIGAALSPLIGSSLYFLLSGNITLSMAALYCSYRSSAVVQMTTLNVQRAEIIFYHAIDDVRQTQCGSLGFRNLASNCLDREALSQAVLSPGKVQDLERFVRPYRSVFPVPLLVNPPICRGPLVLANARGSTLAYTTAVDKGMDRPATVMIWYHVGASPLEVIRGFFHMCIFRSMIGEASQGSRREEGAGAGARVPGAASVEDPALVAIHARSARCAEAWWPQFPAALAERVT